MPTIATLLQSAAAQGLPRHEAQYLMLHACERPRHDRAWLLSHDREELQAASLSLWQAAVQRRLQGEPVAYIVGCKAFYGLNLSVSPAVLDPRDDTETLVDWALELIPKDQAFKVLDLGTGSGAVALAIRSQRPFVQMTATDASAEALAMASRNAAELQLPVRFVQADARNPDWFSALPNEAFDLIVSNPPYIAEGDTHLAALKHEPAMALTSGADGLDAIRSIIQHATSHLHSGAWLLLEHGYEQAERVHDLFAAHGFADATTRRDLGSVDRCTGARFVR
ncbi:peptide chain release factor N(5)-glutamine methyltransferase [Variovorax sp. PCZ-1]|uniref:peptide chain release factor N(5)-glutamine methyltransferase n=1 Tax=Variovorax sp. PCZ-1 TaxID=2835533 RepID=UPI0020BFFF41|nr:peptide chain release factor N(5)-glutamine methyltransferase [Variovorax sp. PCZ-1]